MARAYVLIPFKDCTGVLAECLASVLPQLPESTEIALVDDGSRTDASHAPELQAFVADSRVHLLRHSRSEGPAAARNTGLDWCRRNGAEIVILLDSDCLAKPGVVDAHLDLHRQYADVACIGGAIRGQGRGPWARLDGLMSWFTSVPGSPERVVREPYHLPTTNMSLKLSRLAGLFPLFDPRLRTGEDVHFVKALRRRNETLLFSPRPEVVHRDRGSFSGFLRHQWAWGLHTYVVRFGQAGHSAAVRVLLAAALTLALPCYALAATFLNVVPWFKRSPWYALYAPLMVPFYIAKGVAVVVGTLRPERALYALSGAPAGVAEARVTGPSA